MRKNLQQMALCALLSVLAMSVYAQGRVKKYYLTGKMGGRIETVIGCEIADEGLVAGNIYYPNVKEPEPILLVGHQGPDGQIFLNEYQSDGTVTGSITFKLGRKVGSGLLAIESGEWRNPNTGATYSLTGMKAKVLSPLPGTTGFPSWYNNPLQPESPDHIGREYSYSIWNDRYECMMGGTVSFRAAGRHRVHFTVSNCPGNMAEGESEAGRPAELNGNSFVYTEVNECHYAFKATFFRDFVVLRTMPVNGMTMGCFGMGVSFQGVYIKVEQ